MWNMPNRDRLINIFVVLRTVKVFVYRNTRVSWVIEFVLGGPSVIVQVFEIIFVFLRTVKVCI